MTVLVRSCLSFHRQRISFHRQRSFTSSPYSTRGASVVAAKQDPFVENYGADLVYGIQPVLSALGSTRRCTMYSLYVQESTAASRKSEKSTAASRARKEQISRARALAERRNIPVQWHTKHHLNAVTKNASHQGLVLAASPLDFLPLLELGVPEGVAPQLWLALDQVVDPQNLGALLRSSHFFGLSGVVASARNAAPLTPVVSKASAGAMESMEIHGVPNLVQFLERCKGNGWRVLGAGIREHECTSSRDIKLDSPTILVLGNEGSGLRKNVERQCDAMVHIAGATGPRGDLDSLNVSVAGGILMHQLSHPMAHR